MHGFVEKTPVLRGTDRLYSDLGERLRLHAIQVR
jgi:hypothetical protein